MGRLFPSAEGTGFAVRRATGCGVPHQRLSALRPLGLGGQIPNGDRAHAPPERWSTALNMSTNSSTGAEHFGETNPRKERRAFWRNEPKSSAQHFSAPAGMIATTSQEELEWILESPPD